MDTGPGTRPTRQRRSGGPLPSADPQEARRIFAMLLPLVEPLQRAIPGSAEVVLHDFAKLPNSVVAIAGRVSGRTVGSPATDSLLRAVASGHVETTDVYDVRLPGGRELRSTNVVFRDSHGAPAYALSIIIDVTMWRAVHALASSMLPPGPVDPRSEPADVEHYAGDVETLAQHLLKQALTASGVPLALMHKRHKKAAVADLKERGFFLIRDSVETAAAALEVTRFTIYNYLNEIDAESAATRLAEPVP